MVLHSRWSLSRGIHIKIISGANQTVFILSFKNEADSQDESYVYSYWIPGHKVSSSESQWSLFKGKSSTCCHKKWTLVLHCRVVSEPRLNA